MFRKRYIDMLGKKTRGCNTEARTAVLKMIYTKIQASKEEGLYEREVTVLDGIEYIHISLSEIVEIAGYKGKKYPKQYARNLLKHILRNGVIKEYDTGEKERGSAYTKKRYGIADINLILELMDKKEKLTQKWLYPTRCRKAMEATEIFIEEARLAGVKEQEIRSSRFFKRIGRILKDFFLGDVGKFRAWIRYIYDQGKKGTYMLLRNDAEVLRFFVLKTFKNIYKRYEKGFRMSKYYWEDRDDDEDITVYGEGEKASEYKATYRWRYEAKEESKEEKQPEVIEEREYPRGATEVMRQAFDEVYSTLGKSMYRQEILEGVEISGDTVLVGNNFHWKVGAILKMYGIKYDFRRESKIDEDRAEQFLQKYLARAGL